MISSFYKKFGKKRTKIRQPKARIITKPRLKSITPKTVRKERERFAASLKPARSERWFESLYTPHKDAGDFFNKPLGNFIPDISNYKYRYVLEIDGSIHDLPEVQARDLRKNAYYAENSFKVIRVRAFDDVSFKRALFLLNVLRRKILKRNLMSLSQEQIDLYMQHGRIS
jgi:hypothetical protein